MALDVVALNKAMKAQKNPASAETIKASVDEYLEKNPVQAYDDSEIKSQQALVNISESTDITSQSLEAGKRYQIGKRIYNFAKDNLPSDAMVSLKVKNGYLFIGNKNGVDLADFGIVDGDDITDILELLAMVTNFTGFLIKIPAGTYLVSRPIKFQRSVSIVGEGAQAFVTTDFAYHHTILKYIGETSTDAVINVPTRSMIKDLSVVAENFKLAVDRTKYTGTIADCFTETLGMEISAINGVSQCTFENVSVCGFNGYGIYSFYSIYSNVTVWHCKTGIYDKTDAVMSNILLRYCGRGVEMNGGLLNVSSIRFEDIENTCVTGTGKSVTIRGIVDWCGGAIMEGVFSNSVVSLIGRAACCTGETDNALFRFKNGHTGGEFECTTTFNPMDTGNTKITVPISISIGNSVEMKFKSTTLINSDNIKRLVRTISADMWSRDITLIDGKNEYYLRGGFNNAGPTQIFVNNVFKGSATEAMLDRDGTFGRYSTGAIYGRIGGDLRLIRDTDENEASRYATALEKNTGVINVKFHGLKGDGKTDDTAALQELIGTTGVTSPKVLYFPKGVYLITDTIKLRHRLKLIGDEVSGGGGFGFNNKIITTATLNNGSVIVFKPTEGDKTAFEADADTCYELGVYNLGFLCESYNTNTTGNVAVQGSPTNYFKSEITLSGINCLDSRNVPNNVMFKGCEFSGFSGSALILGQHHKIDSCSFKYCNIGIECTSWDALIYDSWFCRCGNGVQIDAISGHGTNNVFMYDNWFDQIVDHAVYATGSMMIYFEGGLLDMIDHAGIYAEKNIAQSHINTRTSRCGMYYGGTDKQNIPVDEIKMAGCIVAGGKIEFTRIEVTPHRREISNGKGIVPCFVIGCTEFADNNILNIPVDKEYLFYDPDMTYTTTAVMSTDEAKVKEIIRSSMETVDKKTSYVDQFELGRSIALGSNKVNISNVSSAASLTYLELPVGEVLHVDTCESVNTRTIFIDKNDGTYTVKNDKDSYSNANKSFVVSAGQQYAIVIAKTTDGSKMTQDLIAKIDVYTVSESAGGYFAKQSIYNRMISNAISGDKIITWIDDDTNTDADIAKVKSICDDLKVKCTFAVISDRLGTDKMASIDTLKQYQREGFHVTSHTGNHTRWYKEVDGNPVFTQDEMESDLIGSIVDLKTQGFLDSDMLVYPGSSVSRSDADTVGIVSKWCQCAVLPNGLKFSKGETGRYKINRLFFDKSVHDTNYYKTILDGYSGDDAPWVVFGSHSFKEDQFDAAMIKEVLQYAISNGWKIMTLNQGYKKRKKYYDLQELYGENM